MGNFIDMAAVLAPENDVEKHLSAAGADGAATCFSESEDKTLVLFEEATGAFDRIARLSKEVESSVFGLHIHDDDLWMYQFYKAGELIDRFNPIPDYWDKISAEERESWKGNAGVIVENWPNLAVDEIERFLISHDSPKFDPEAKAYPDDEFESGDAWQVCDFLKKLGTPYPD